MTRNELFLRENAATAAYHHGNADGAVDYVLKLYERIITKKLYRFRPPKMHEVEALNNKKIYLCRPSVYEDSGDCKIEYDLPDMFKYFITEIKPEKYKNLQALLLDKNKIDELVNTMSANPQFIKLNEKIRNECLVACISQTYSDYMWMNYAQQHEGICLEYNLEQILFAIKDDLRFFPIRYVESRSNLQDIRFNSSDYNDTDEAYHRSRLKYILSCLTKDKVPYSKESEWRLLCEYMELEEDKNGYFFDFVSPSKIYLGKNISKNQDFATAVINFCDANKIPYNSL